MPKFQVLFPQKAKGDLDSLEPKVRERIIKKIKWLSRNFANITPIPLQGVCSDFFKLRVGDYRVIYDLDYEESKIIVRYIDHRSNVYE